MKVKVVSLVLILFIISAFAGSQLSAFSEPVLPAAAAPAATDPATGLSKAELAEARFQELWTSIEWGKNEKPAYEVFRKGMVGYLNLSRQNKLNNTGILTLIDFSLSSQKKRMWILDLKKQKLLFHELVAHGKNSGGDMANAFSNTPNSNQSSLGFYVTQETYIGKYGLSLRLAGQEKGFNDLARARAIVLHGADYVNESIGKNLGRLGRSFGCPAVRREVSEAVVKTLASGTCMFIYHPSKDYLAQSKLLLEEGALDVLLAGTI
ncbi:murein L,D-transpeptidase catalytic domain family protein [Cesiribacter andamanensis]|uniref:L,D-transpeptidase catalytic domain protein n=1 Tax=Cesiribacter andamanensis AMV16 TaxID=1279009 RepID=M7NI24_9BACT|nr:murein L,D-transpeptidase catalytic domain family protein [Cesiribacter andamanensis]EMR01460.1 hypothetical protein ADICEAN_03416 [Cesiribacter andamanensis AMV16]